MRHPMLESRTRPRCKLILAPMGLDPGVVQGVTFRDGVEVANTLKQHAA
jgi:hypothetical protein